MKPTSISKVINPKSRLKFCLLAVTVAAMLSLASSGVAERYLAVNVTAKVRKQDRKTVNGVDLDFIATPSAHIVVSKALINFARGGHAQDPVPANLILAVRLGSDIQPALVVFDKTGASPPLVIATFDFEEINKLHNQKPAPSGCPDQAIETSSEALVMLTFQDVGKIKGGSVHLYGKGVEQQISNSPCDTLTKSVSGSGTGTIDTVADDNPDQIQHALFANFTFSTGKDLSTP